MSVHVHLATNEADYAALGALVREYVEWCRARFAQDVWLINEALSHQSLDRELESLATRYGPPGGKAFLARRDGEIVGCGAYRRRSDEYCEMKRLFVPDRYRGHSIGRKLCDAIIASAREDRFKLMRLDTAAQMSEAVSLYEAIGFKRCAPYNDYPERLMPHMVFMELALDNG
ncbi:GNAT family N-acetyltransferase [Dongia deserti]|uniref:GNAT family N-acetyltransferase n=1 Tax=Dongia deserti TaxID=2268030 RepID=UPI000E657B0D|nr:GNAT family N-acetyltransferase [Dongia deserti]